MSDGITQVIFEYFGNYGISGDFQSFANIGFKAIYSPDWIVSCCEGEPFVKPKPLVKVGETVVVQELDFVRLIKAIILDGETINLVIDIFENVVE